MSNVKKIEKPLDPRLAKVLKVLSDQVLGLDRYLENLQDPERQVQPILEDLAKALDRLALACRHQIVTLTEDDHRAINPLLLVTLLNVKSEMNSALMDLEVRPQAPTRWEDFAKSVSEVVKTAKAVQQVITQPGAAAQVSVQGEPLRGPDGQLMEVGS